MLGKKNENIQNPVKYVITAQFKYLSNCLILWQTLAHPVLFKRLR